MIETALEHDRPVRIGVNWGSLDQELLAHMMDENGQLENPAAAVDVMHEALVVSAIENAQRAEELGMSADKAQESGKDGIHLEDQKQSELSEGDPMPAVVQNRSSVIKVESAAARQSIDIGNINFANLDDFLDQENDDDMIF